MGRSRERVGDEEKKSGGGSKEERDREDTLGEMGWICRESIQHWSPGSILRFWFKLKRRNVENLCRVRKLHLKSLDLGVVHTHTVDIAKARV